MTRLIFALMMVTMVFSACKKDFSEINTNPNNPNQVESSLLLRQVSYDLMEQLSYEGFVAGDLLAQHLTMVDFNLFDRHSLRDPQLGGNPWPILYQILRDLEILIQQANEKEEDAVYLGPAKILKAYAAGVLTDVYGDVPYSEALQGLQGLVKPAYDRQEDIYLADGGILDLLREAENLLENYSGAFSLQGDILYGGDLLAWKTFANSLRFKHLLRIAQKEDVKMELQEIYDEGQLILLNSQNASYNFTNSKPNSFRMQQLRDGDFNLYVMSLTTEELLNKYQDPRREILFQSIGSDPSDSLYRGLLNGPDASSTSISVSDYSLAGTIFRTETDKLDACYLSAWETHFLVAEAAERGWIVADAKSHYDLGVQMAFDYWHTALPSSYLITDSAAYMSFGQDPLQQILEQKWLASMINGYESWIEFRRTGFPMLKPVAASLNGGDYPLRMPYPSEEEALNPENYADATAGNDNSVNFPVWWDVD